MSEKYKGEISLHQMEIASLQSCVLQSQQASSNGTEKREEEHTNALLSLQARLNDSQQALGHRDAVYAKSMQVSEESAAHQAARAKIAEQLVGTLEAQVDSMKSQIALITSQLHAAHEPREAGDVGDGAGLRASTSEAEELNRQLSLSKAALACLQERALLLPERYETGDLVRHNHRGLCYHSNELFRPTSNAISSILWSRCPIPLMCKSWLRKKMNFEGCGKSFIVYRR